MQARGSVVTLRVTRSQNQARREVEDNGPGLSPADLAHVFERFWRASELPGGCGLGLAILAAIAHCHGGTATAQAAQTQGLRVKLSLPLAA